MNDRLMNLLNSNFSQAAERAFWLYSQKTRFIGEIPLSYAPLTIPSQDVNSQCQLGSKN